MVAVFDPSIFTQGAQLQQANNARLQGTFDNIIGMYMANEEKKAKKAELMKAEAMKPENILAAKIAGQPITPEQQARFEAFNVMQQSKMAQNPVTGELYSPYKDINKVMGQSVSDILYSAPSGSAPVPTMGGAQQSSVSEMLFDDPAGDGAYNVNNLPNTGLPNDMIDPNMVSIPMPDTSNLNPKAAQIATEEGIKANLDLEKQKRMEEFKAKKEGVKAEKGRNQIDVVLADMKSDYEALQELNAIREVEAPLSQNLKNYLATTGLGSAVAQATGSQAEAIRERIRTSKPKMMGAMKDALGLTGTELNSQQELQFYLNALTDPSQDFETNMLNIQRLSRDWGGGAFDPKKQTQTSDPLGLFNQ